ncbi:MAG: GDP-mannose 4,6-dehydratase, partial [Chitinophagaceae bacterium]
RDWGHARDYVEGMWRMLQHEVPEDFVLATGITTSVRDMVRLCFEQVGIEIEFKGEGIDEKGFVVSCSNSEYQLPKGKEILAIDPRYFRPAEVDLLVGDASKAKRLLGWEPKTPFRELIREMMESDLAIEKQSHLLDNLKG